MHVNVRRDGGPALHHIAADEVCYEMLKLTDLSCGSHLQDAPFSDADPAESFSQGAVEYAPPRAKSVIKNRALHIQCIQPQSLCERITTECFRERT